MNKLLSISLAFVLALGCGFILLHCDDDNTEEEYELTPTPEPTKTPRLTNTPKPTHTGGTGNTPTPRPTEPPRETPTPEATDTPHPRTSCDFYGPTGITPHQGNWTIDGTARTFAVRYSGGRFWIDPDWDDYFQGGWGGHPYPTFGSRDVEDGSFAFQWGELAGRHCPNDGFCFAGHFTTPEEATVILQTHFACEIESSRETTASLSK